MIPKQAYIPSLMDREYYKNKVATDPSWRPLCPSLVCVASKARHMIKISGGFHCNYCKHEVYNDMMPKERKAA